MYMYNKYYNINSQVTCENLLAKTTRDGEHLRRC